MKLRELTAPFERKKVVTYKADHNTPTVKQKELQFVYGTVYRDTTTCDTHSPKSGNFYAYFHRVNLGILLGGVWDPDEKDLDEVKTLCDRKHIATLDDLASELKRRAKNAEFISAAELEFVRLAMPELFCSCQAGRQAYMEAQAKREAEEKAKQEADDEEFCREKNEAANTVLSHALEVIRNDGTLKNEFISFYKARYSSSSYSVINYIARNYGVQIPLKVQGWINNSLSEVTIQNGAVHRWMRTSRSKTFPHYMNQVIAAVRGDSEAE